MTQEFADVAGLAVAYLAPIVAPVPVGTRLEKGETEFLQVRRVGGNPLVPFRESVVLDVWAWADTEPRATEIALQARTAIWELNGPSELLGITSYQVTERQAPRALDDPRSSRPRIWATYVVVVRADRVTPYTAPTNSP